MTRAVWVSFFQATWGLSTGKQAGRAQGRDAGPPQLGALTPFPTRYPVLNSSRWSCRVVTALGGPAALGALVRGEVDRLLLRHRPRDPDARPAPSPPVDRSGPGHRLLLLGLPRGSLPLRGGEGAASPGVAAVTAAVVGGGTGWGPSPLQWGWEGRACSGGGPAVIVDDDPLLLAATAGPEIVLAALEPPTGGGGSGAAGSLRPRGKALATPAAHVPQTRGSSGGRGSSGRGAGRPTGRGRGGVRGRGRSPVGSGDG